MGINDNTGSKQAFAKLEGFTLPEPTKPAPEVTVTGIDAPEGHEESPYEVWFNIKCTTGDAVTAKYAANYEREWEVELHDSFSFLLRSRILNLALAGFNELGAVMSCHASI